METRFVAGTYKRKKKQRRKKLYTRARLLSYIRFFDAEHGRPPTETEMKVAMGGIQNVHYHLVQLQKAGYLKLKRKRCWNIELLDLEDGPVLNC
jgi:SOS-response transcriptional repressor LexA